MDTYRHWPKYPLRHNPQAVTYVRGQAGLSKTQLAQLCGVGVSLISELEKGTRNATPEILNKLAVVLGCPRTLLQRTMPLDGIENPVAYQAIHHPRGELGVTRAEAEAFIRFASEFLSRSKWSSPTPEGLEEVYLETIPVDSGHEDLHIYMQELGDNVRQTLREDFRVWAYRHAIRNF